MVNESMLNDREFSIVWSIPASEWAKCRTESVKHGVGSNYDRAGLGRYYLLYGDLDFKRGSEPYYGNVHGGRGIELSLWDFAVALADGYLSHGFAPGVTTVYQQLDDDLRIQFEAKDDAMTISASDRPTAFVVSRDNFVAAVKDFLRSIGASIKAQVPAILEWDSMAPLRDVVRDSRAD